MENKTCILILVDRGDEVIDFATIKQKDLVAGISKSSSMALLELGFGFLSRNESKTCEKIFGPKRGEQIMMAIPGHKMFFNSNGRVQTTYKKIKGRIRKKKLENL
jgi:hypothetical protein